MAGLPWFKQQVDLRRDPRALILGDILGDPRAWTYVVEMRMYLAENAPTGCVSGAHADIALERGSGWTGERGKLLAALRDAGFISITPARELVGIQIEDLDWVREQGAHVRKFQSDAQKPDGRAHKVVNPSRDTGGSSAAPARLPRGESRELRVEKEEETTLSTSVDTLPLGEPVASGASVMDPPETSPGRALCGLWNDEAAPGLPMCREVTAKRQKAAQARLRERSFDDWKLILRRINASPFCLGVNERGWKADVDFFLRPDTATKVLEGKYDPRPGETLPKKPDLFAEDWVTT